MHLIKLRDKFASVDTCNTNAKLGNNLCKKIDNVAEDKQLLPLMIDGEIVKTTIEPCQHQERNTHIGGVAKECTKHTQSMLEENCISTDDDGLRIHTTCTQLHVALDKEFSYARNYPKGVFIIFLM